MLGSTPRTAISRGRPCERGPVCRELGQEGAQGGWCLDHAAENAGGPARAQPSASSMQSPPASVEATSVSSLSPVLARPGAPPRSR